MKGNNEVTRLLNTRYPIIQAPMLGVTSPAMVAAISEAGGLGSLPVGGLSPDQTRALIKAVKALTSKPFAVNLFAYDAPAPDEARMAAMQEFLAGHCTRPGFTIEKDLPAPGRIFPYHDQVPVLLEENIAVVSVTFGIPDDASIRLLKEKKVILIGTATSLAEALAVQEKGLDMVTAQGAEAGGHRGTFLQEPQLPLIGTLALVPLLAERLSIPVLAAGGIADGRAITAAMTLGAAGVQAGSVFLACDESLAPPYFKNMLKHCKENDFVVTRALTGRWARGINNALIRAIESSGVPVPAYPYQNLLITPIRMRAQELADPEYAVMWAGQAANRAEQKSASEIFKRLVETAADF